MPIPFSTLIVGINYDMQVQLREEKLQEENAVYEKALSNCENKIQEKMQEADLLHKKLEVRLLYCSLISLCYSSSYCMIFYVHI